MTQAGRPVAVIGIYPQIPRHYLLLFDSIVMNNIESALDAYAMAPDKDLQQGIADIRYLQERGVLELRMPSEEISEQYEEELLEYLLAVEESTPIQLRLPAAPSVNELAERAKGELRSSREQEKGWAIERRKIDARARLTAIQLRHEGINAVPVLSSIGPEKEGGLTSAEVAEITLSALPAPSQDTPLESILEFRDDEEAIGTLAALHRWMRKTVVEAKSTQELRDEIEELLYLHSRHLKTHRMKYKNARLKTLVTAPLEILESIIKLRLSGLAAKPFEMREARINLLQAELTGPGGEVAFIERAAREFSPVETHSKPRSPAKRKKEKTITSIEQHINECAELLRGKGYDPHLSGNLITFERNGSTYAMPRDPHDLNYYPVIYPDFWTVTPDEEEEATLVLSNMITLHRKGVHISFDSKIRRASASTEMLFTAPAHFISHLPRMLNMIQAGVELFVDGMMQWRDEQASQPGEGQAAQEES
ncbi:hypothetical protein AB0G86_34055 [Streptomyces scabiei]|uniref:hypothetical protein n=1 Tax=Streptomyces scabiei TaxID=1930 RepID=UPI0033CF8875